MISVRVLTSGATPEHQDRFWRSTARQTISINQDLLETTEWSSMGMSISWRILVRFFSSSSLVGCLLRTFFFYCKITVSVKSTSAFSSGQSLANKVNIDADLNSKCSPVFSINLAWTSQAKLLLKTESWQILFIKVFLVRSYTFLCIRSFYACFSLSRGWNDNISSLGSPWSTPCLARAQRPAAGARARGNATAVQHTAAWNRTGLLAIHSNQI